MVLAGMAWAIWVVRLAATLTLTLTTTLPCLALPVLAVLAVRLS